MVASLSLRALPGAAVLRDEADRRHGGEPGPARAGRVDARCGRRCSASSRGRGPDRRRVGRLVRLVFEPHPGAGARPAAGLHLRPAAQPDLLRQHADRQGRAPSHAAARADGHAVRAHQLGLRAARGAVRPPAGAVLPRATDVRGDPARLAGDLRDDRGGHGAADRHVRRGPQRRQGAADRAHRRLVHQHPQRDLLRGARTRGPHRARVGGRDLPGAARAVPRLRAHAHGAAGAESC